MSTQVSTLTPPTAGKIAPHETNEVRLVLSGSKPLAAIEQAKQPIMYALAVSMARTGALKAHFILDNAEVIIVKPQNWRLLIEYLNLLDHGVQELGIKEYHRRMGRLFGYTDEDIEAFVASDIHCECNKCRGNFVMSTDTSKGFETLHKGAVSGRTVEQARMSAKMLGTKLLRDATKVERDQYEHRFGKFVR